MSTFRLEPEHLFLTTGTFNLLSKTDPHFRLSGAFSVRRDPLQDLGVLETFQNYRAPATAVNPLRSQDFHLFSTAGSVDPRIVDPRLDSAKTGELFLQRARKRAPTRARQRSGAGRSGRRSKIKDRLEALLFAETLQGTLSPNANPGKGSVGGLLNLMPKATARIQRAAQTLVHLSSVDLLYQSERHCARGE